MKSHLVPKNHPNQIHVIYKKSYKIPFIGGFIPSIGGFLPPFDQANDPNDSKPSTPQESGRPLLRHWPGAHNKENFASFNRYFWWSFMKLYGVLLGFTEVCTLLLSFNEFLKFMELFDDMHLN